MGGHRSTSMQSLGTCVAVCPEDCIEMPWPNLVPTLVPGRDCTSCGLCIKVCPGKEVLYDDLSLRLFGRHPRYGDEYFGACRSYYLGHAADPVIWRRAAGGGIVSALASWLLESGEVDGVILCGMSEDEPWKTVGKLVRTREEVLENTGTRYSIVPTNVVLREIREAEGKYALIGAGGLIVLALVIIAISAPWITTHDPIDLNPRFAPVASKRRDGTWS